MYRKNLIGVIGILSLVLSSCSSGFLSGLIGISDTGGLDVAPIKDALAPDFELETIDGDTLKLSDFRGKAVLINFWATWCGPCRVEMPALQSRFESYSLDFVILAVDNDETWEIVSAFVDELGLTFNVLLDPGAVIQDLYQIRGYPSSIFVDVDGIIRVVHIGIMTEGQLDGYLAEVGIGDG